jgi:hypothetical protein
VSHCVARGTPYRPGVGPAGAPRRLGRRTRTVRERRRARAGRRAGPAFTRSRAPPSPSPRLTPPFRPRARVATVSLAVFAAPPAASGCAGRTRAGPASTRRASDDAAIRGTLDGVMRARNGADLPAHVARYLDSAAFMTAAGPVRGRKRTTSAQTSPSPTRCSTRRGCDDPRLAPRRPCAHVAPSTAQPARHPPCAPGPFRSRCAAPRAARPRLREYPTRRRERRCRAARAERAGGRAG